MSAKLQFPLLPMLIVLAAAVASAVSLPLAMADDCPFNITWIQDEYAQDVNGDGFATVPEGQVDIDSDGWFTEVEANYFGMCDFLDWKPKQGQIATVDNSVCSKRLGCFGNFNQYRCRARVGEPGCWTEKK